MMGLAPARRRLRPRFAAAKALAITGTHLSTDRRARGIARAIALAKQHGLKLVLDVDYRPVLWGLAGHGGGADREKARPRRPGRSRPSCPTSTWSSAPKRRFASRAAGRARSRPLQAIRARTGATLVMKRGVAGCVVFEGPIPASVEQGLVVGGFPVEVLNVLGAGDAFLSGYLSGWIEGMPAAHGGRRGNAAGAIVVTRHGCTPAMPTRAELEDFLGRVATARAAGPRCAHRRAAPRYERAGRRATCASSPSTIAASWSSSRPRAAPTTRESRISRRWSPSRARGRCRAAPGIEPRRHRRRASRRLGARSPDASGRLDWTSRRTTRLATARVRGDGRHRARTACIGPAPRRQVPRESTIRPIPLSCALRRKRGLPNSQHATDSLERELLLEVISSGPGRSSMPARRPP